MYPGLSHADCQVAEFRYRQLVTQGKQQQSVVGIRRAPIDNRAVPAAIRQQIGTFLVQAGERLQGAHAVTGNSFGSSAAGEQTAIA